MKTKAAIAQILKDEGVDFLSCFPSNPIIDACAAVDIRPVVARTERVVVNIADGYSRLAGDDRIGVCAMQEGAGIENAFAGVAQAYADSIPVLVLPAFWGHDQTDISHFDTRANLDHVTKWSAQVNAPDRVPELMRRAFTQMRTGRPGPVVLEVPKDVAEQELTKDFTYTPVVRHRTGPDPSDVTTAIEMLLKAERPVLLAGGGVHKGQAWDELRALAEALSIPVVTTMNGKSAFPETHPLSLGVAGLTTTGMAWQFLKDTDMVLAVGASMTKWWMFPPIPAGCRIIQCTIDERDLNKDHAIAHAVLGDSKLVLDALAKEARAQVAKSDGRARDDVTPEIAAHREQWLEEWMPKLTSDETPINPYRLMWDLNRTLDKASSIITHDSGNPRDQLAPFYQSEIPQGYMGWGHSTQLGFSMGLGIGLKLARPDMTVVNVLGDAGIGMGGFDLETAVRAKVGTVTVVVNNGLMGNYEQFIPIAIERYGAKLLGGDYTKIAEGLGAYAERVTAPDDITGAIERAVEVSKSGKPALLEVMTREETAFSKYY
jgi:thiamine pyrophosphate-dependent acetolactate synthase large subunit-like protein